MRIKKLRLKNGYKRFFDLTIDLGDSPQKIIALVGPNGCGKSSVFDGMLFHHNAHGKIGDKAAKGAQYHSMKGESIFSHGNIEIEFEEGSYKVVRDAKQAKGKQNTIFSFRSPYRYNSNLMVKETKATTEISLNSYGAGCASDLDDKMIENYRRLYVKYNKYMNDVDCAPSEAKKKIIGDINSSLSKCLDLEISSIGSVEASQGTLYFRKKHHPAEFEFNVLSSGEKEVVDILLDLYLRKDEYDETVFLLDEPELHINTNIQKNLLIEIDRMIGDNCQVWIATHSIGFLRTLQEELKGKCQIIQFKKGDELASSAHTLTPMQISRAAWLGLFEIALDDLASLVCPSRIVYCEGRDAPDSVGRERGLDAKVFNNIFSTEYHDTLFVSSGGNTELDQRSDIAISIFGKVFSELEILVLKDRDMASGRNTSQNDRQVYLNNNSGHHRVLKRWEIENYLYDKEVLSKYCLENALEFDEKAYDEFVTDIDNQNLKDATGRIKNICNITSSINADQFKLNLSKYIYVGMEVYQDLNSSIFP